MHRHGPPLPPAVREVLSRARAHLHPDTLSVVARRCLPGAELACARLLDESLRKVLPPGLSMSAHVVAEFRRVFPLPPPPPETPRDAGPRWAPTQPLEGYDPTTPFFAGASGPAWPAAAHPFDTARWGRGPAVPAVALDLHALNGLLALVGGRM